MSKKEKYICPPWLCITFDNPLRNLVHNRERILGEYVQIGSTVLDIGPGKGFFTGTLTELVGSEGRVVAIDVQQEMLDLVSRRVSKSGYPDRLDIKLAEPNRLGIDGPFDFALAFWMYHEVPDQTAFMSELFDNINVNGRVLVAEPKMHVKSRPFQSSLETAQSVGFSLVGSPNIWFSRTALLEKTS